MNQIRLEIMMPTFYCVHLTCEIYLFFKDLRVCRPFSDIDVYRGCVVKQEYL